MKSLENIKEDLICVTTDLLYSNMYDSSYICDSGSISNNLYATAFFENNNKSNKL